MPNRLKTMKVQNEPDQTGELGNNEDAWPVLPAGEEVSDLPAKHHLTEQANCPSSSRGKGTEQLGWGRGRCSGWFLQSSACLFAHPGAAEMPAWRSFVPRVLERCP